MNNLKNEARAEAVADIIKFFEPQGLYILYVENDKWGRDIFHLIDPNGDWDLYLARFIFDDLSVIAEVRSGGSVFALSYPLRENDLLAVAKVLENRLENK